MSRRITVPSVVTVVALSSLALLQACDKPSNGTAAAAASAPSAASSAAETAPAGASIVKVDPSLVCMVNNQFMGKPQIPVSVGAVTYYGCCEMCKSRLANDPGSRVAVDPVSGKQVDKASAVIGRKASGAVVYFESEANLLAYARSNSDS